MRIARWTVTGMAVLALGAGLAAKKWTQWSPVNACLCLRPDSGGTTAADTSSDPLGGAAAYSGRGSGAGGAVNLGALAATPLGGGNAGARAASGSQGGRHSWAAWGSGAHFARYSNGGGSGPSAGLGGLWRMMSLARHQSAPGVSTPRAPRAARVASARAPRASHGSPTAGSGPPSVTATQPTLVAQAGNSFGTHETPISGLVNPSAGSGT